MITRTYTTTDSDLDAIFGMGGVHRAGCLPHVEGHVGHGLGVLWACVQETSCYHVGIPNSLNL